MIHTMLNRNTVEARTIQNTLFTHSTYHQLLVSTGFLPLANMRFFLCDP